MFKKQPICEVCGDNEATFVSLIPVQPNSMDGSWKFTCDCTSQIEKNPLPINKIFSSPTATAEWLEHMREKNWFKKDDFLAMMNRYHDWQGIEK
ncbi:MAG: hypothetical protein COB23_06025 [Methylophaga sp.]|nr:MAG: hypothetical protein COB23_06025 [Methylophaga sp.]